MLNHPTPTPPVLAQGMRLGPHALCTNLWLAPLAGWTSLAFREGVRALGGVGLAVTEVVSAPALLAGGKRRNQYTLTSERDSPLSVQVNARDAEEARLAAKWVEDNGYAAVDFNLGCPVRKITRKGGGASLGRSPEQTAEVIGAAVDAVRIPVTAKIRLGWDVGDLTGPDVTRALEQVGVSAVVVHGRTRAQAFAGTVDREGIRAVASAVSIPVLANGDVLTSQDARSLLRDTGAAGLMIGRGAIENPWLFAELAGLRDTPPSVEERIAFARGHFDRLLTIRPEGVAARLFRKILFVYVSAAGGQAALGEPAVRVDTATDVHAVLDRLALVPLQKRLPGGLVKTPKRPVDHW